jgi:tetratricopeptide (TPR) repeat protein
LIAVLLLALSTPATDVACAALEGKVVDRALARLGDDAKYEPLRGVARLLTKNRLRAAKHLSGEPAFAAYYAMAQKNGPGGLGRARQTLAEASRAKDAPADVLFLAALAFDAAGQREEAHAKLKRALATAKDALDPAFAPDPANGLVRALEHAGESPAAIHGCLLAAGRTNLTLRVADGDASELAVWKDIDDTQALTLAKRVVADDPGDEEALSTLLTILVRKRDFEEVRRRLAKTESEAPAVLRARARIAIEDKDARKAVDAARAAAEKDPKSDVGVALIVEAMMLDGAADEAQAFVDTLLARRPVDVDPYALLVRVQRARGAKRQVQLNEVRSQGFVADWSARRQRVADAERIFRAVRSAERQKDDTGLRAIGGKDVRRRLPADLAIARLGRAGSARAARDRIFDACTDDLSRFLTRTRAWERRVEKTKVYPKPREVVVTLSAADPTRCARTAPLTGRRKARRRK